MRAKIYVEIPADESWKRGQPLRHLILAHILLTGPVLTFGWAAYAGVTATELVMCALGCLALGLSITAGYHRLFSHRAYKCSRWFKRLLLLVGVFSGQGTVWNWAWGHRRHHAYSDRRGDYTSPYTFPKRGKLWAFAWSHVLCQVYNRRPGNFEHNLVRDLARDEDAEIMQGWTDNRRLHLLAIAGVYVLVGATTLGVHRLVSGVWEWKVFVGGALWGFLFPRWYNIHMAFTINSVSHLWGRKPYKSRDGSVNVWWLALPSFGESWHNNHHAFPASARHGLEWWQVDVTWYLLAALRRLGVVWDLRLPRQEKRDSRRRSPRFEVDAKVNVEIGGATVAAILRDVSREGARITFPAGTEIDEELELSLSTSWLWTTVEGRVVRAEPSADGLDVAIETGSDDLWLFAHWIEESTPKHALMGQTPRVPTTPPPAPAPT